MTTPSDEQAAALRPVRAALLRAARADAEELLATARREAAAVVDRARAEAEALIEAARRQGEEEGTAAAAEARLRARRTARARELATCGEAYADLRRRAVEHVRELRRADDYPALRERLRAHARLLLGAECLLAEEPEAGVVATAPGRRADLTLDALASRALERIGQEAETLWAP